MFAVYRMLLKEILFQPKTFSTREPETGGGDVRVYPGRIPGAGETFVTVACAGEQTVTDLMMSALERFGLETDNAVADYRCSEILLDRGGTTNTCNTFSLHIFSSVANVYVRK